MNKLRSATKLRKIVAVCLFEIELFGISQSLMETSTFLYYDYKCDILKKHLTIQYQQFISCSRLVIANCKWDGCHILQHI